MHSWVFQNRARLAVVYGLAPQACATPTLLRPGSILTTPEGILLGPWGRRVS